MMDMSWLKPYTIALVVGVVIIVFAGVFVSVGPGPQSATGYVVYDNDQLPAGELKELLIISKDCRLTPAAFYARPGDRIRLSATTYDAEGRTHRIVVNGLGVEITVRGNEVNYAEFTAPKGTFTIVDAYPCNAQGIKAESKLVVS